MRRIHSETDQSARGPKEGRSRAEALGSGAKEPDFRTEESSAGAEKPAFGTEESCFGTEVSSSGTNGPCSGAEEFDSGAAEFRSAPIWAHRGCRSELVATGAAQRETWARHYAEVGRPEVAARIAASELVLPERLVDRRAELDLGGRRVVLAHFGAAHTDHDLVVHLPDDGITFAGDLVEQGAPPAFEDAHPLDWPGVLDAVLALGADVIVPGHGEPVDRGFVQRQRDELAELAELCRAVRAGELTAEQAVARSPYPAEPTRTALARVVTG
ncbi:MBL fold metallo-hydrolase [Goodfellowiella coeruleoviolacea]|uniref:MBL fold metallo-hydrolase n=1 Tax=Goodfellowiella coeruleoviolacea TaxID=334858 RepID=UPI0027E19C73|nr:MBL fold metallo-hydrolase [Goodfellowiella coeruleoviolacea]